VRGADPRRPLTFPLRLLVRAVSGQSPPSFSSPSSSSQETPGSA
jgi:hypothetical protein